MPHFNPLSTLWGDACSMRRVVQRLKGGRGKLLGVQSMTAGQRGVQSQGVHWSGGALLCCAELSAIQSFIIQSSIHSFID